MESLNVCIEGEIFKVKLVKVIHDTLKPFTKLEEGPPIGSIFIGNLFGRMEFRGGRS